MAPPRRGQPAHAFQSKGRARPGGAAGRYHPPVTVQPPATAPELAPDRGRVMRGVHLGGADLQGVDLTRADLQGAVLAAALLIEVRAHAVRLRGADLTGLRARGLRCRDGDLEGARLARADLQQADLRGAILLEADLRGADLRGADLRYADLRRSDLRGARLDTAFLQGADLTGAQLTGAAVAGCQAHKTCLNWASDASGETLAALMAAGGYSGLHPVVAQVGALGGAAGRRIARGIRSARALGRASQDTVRGGAVDSAAGLLSRLAARAEAGRTRRERKREAATARRESRLEAIHARRVAESDARDARRENRRLRALARRSERTARRHRHAAPTRPSTPPAPRAPTLRAAAERPLPSLARAARRRAEREALLASPTLRQAQETASRTARARRAAEVSRLIAREAARVDAAEERVRLARAAADAEEQASKSAAEEAEALLRSEQEAKRLAAIRAAEEAQQQQDAIEAQRQAAEEARVRAAEEARRRVIAIRRRAEREADAIAARPDRLAAARAAEARALRTDRRPAPSLHPDNVLVRTQRPLPPARVPEGRDRLGRLARILQRESERQHEGDLHLGPGADLAGADLRGRRLGDARLAGADLRGAQLDAARLGGADLSRAMLDAATMENIRLERATLRAASLIGAGLNGGRLREADLSDADLQRATLVDADLRGADLRRADLSDADLTGADLRQALLEGANLRGANLTASRLSDLSLVGVVLDDAIFDQADLAGARLDGASVRGADLGGALGLSGRDRDRLAAAGARAADPGLEALLGRFAPRQLRYAAAILALGLGAWLAARYLSDGGLDSASLEVEAESLRSTDPLQASETYASLAEGAVRIDDQVGYLLEAASLAGEGEDAERARALFGEALDTAADSPGLTGDVRLRMGAFELDEQAWGAARETIAPLLTAEGHPAETRARAVVLVGDARSGADQEGTDPAVVSLFEALSDLPEAEADLRIALALLYTTRADINAALLELDAAGTLDLPSDLARKVRETRANVLDQAGDEAGAAAVWEDLMAAAIDGNPEWHTARLALADLRYRQSRFDDAAELVAPLMAEGVEPQIRGRALLVAGRLAEQSDDLATAAGRYQAVLTLPDADADTEEDARLSLARVLLTGDGAAAEAALADLPEEAAAGIMAHARLGEARRLLDEGDAAAALEVYEALSEGAEGTPEIARDALSGQAEALAQLGELDAAVSVWRELLADAPSTEDRLGLELQLAHGLLQGGDPAEASSAFRALSASTDPDVRFQGLLGLAEVARAQGETERARGLFRQVADQSPDPAYQVHALQELADLAAAQERTADALEALRALVAAAPPGSSAAADARLALVLTLGDAGEVEEALRICTQAEATAQEPLARARAALACAELLERTGASVAAMSRYGDVLAYPGVPADVRTDAWLGQGRAAMLAGEPAQALAASDDGLAQTETPTLRLPLLAAKVQALRALDRPAPLEAALAERDALAELVPALAGPLLVDAAATARGRGQPDAAVELLERAIALPLSPEARAGALVELGDTLLEAGRLEDAGTRFAEAEAKEGIDDTTRFAAGMGRAEVLRQQGDLSGTAEALAELEPPGPDAERWWLETQARVLTELGEDEAARSAWGALAGAADDAPGSRAAALRGEADLLLGADDAEGALPLYEEATRTAPEPAAAGWAELGAVEALVMLGRGEQARGRLARLRAHDDPEVALQARLRGAAMHAEAEDWASALELLDVAPSRELGPGWDASFVELAAVAHAGAGDLASARGAWQGLADRWPGSKEALLPAWLGLADVARAEGELAQARTWADRALDEAEDPGYRQRAEDLIAQLGG